MHNKVAAAELLPGASQGNAAEREAVATASSAQLALRCALAGKAVARRTPATNLGCALAAASLAQLTPRCSLAMHWKLQAPRASRCALVGLAAARPTSATAVGCALAAPSLA
ncbi:hypothetical protein CYMTET_32086 [Cymbomonas tetramitiformis]|uniref:Uncharacterized protein n=1 Tax=Cymbomonas tetramitiformis TaxID=36881 RepID=A0AAE0FGH3_9CHLO|nr:hypothetical protein CYMTET_32086 [Cymbomonas tetramitiformis]